MKKFSWILLLAAAIIWGYAFVIVKSSLDLIPPLYMVAFRFTIATIFLAVIFLPKMNNIKKSSWPRGLVLGAMLFLAHGVQTIGCKYTTAGNNAFLTALYVILVPIIGAMFFKRKTGPLAYICAVIAFVGIGLICLGGVFTFNIGDFLTLVCGVLYAFHIIFLEDYTQKEDVFILTMLQFLFASIFAWLVAPLYDGIMPQVQVSQDLVIGILYLGIMSSGLAFLFQSIGQKYTNAAASAILLCMESVFGAIFGVIFLHEVMTVSAAIGCAIMFIAIVISETKLSFIPHVGDFLKKLDGNIEEK